MDDNIRNLIFQAIDQTISEQDFHRLQDELEHSEEVRDEYLRVVSLSETLGDIAVDAAGSAGTGGPDLKQDPRHDQLVDGSSVSGRQDKRIARGGAPDSFGWDLRSPRLLATVATLLFVVSAAAFLLGRSEIARQPGAVSRSVEQPEAVVDRTKEESLIAGHATLRRSVDLEWTDADVSWRDGDVLPDGPLNFEHGIAEIDFFCGATLIVEGPATLDIESDWSVRVIRGRLRANVPPAAQGFVVRAGESDIVDLGTEFALEVGADNARVEVIDGEVELRGGEHDGRHLVTGQRQWLKGTRDLPESLDNLSTLKDLQRRHQDAGVQRFAQWKAHSSDLRTDRRLIAYFSIADSRPERIVPNLASTGSILDGQLVGPVRRTHGRFGPESTGLEFDRPGARVRTRIDGEFHAFTLACWVKIDSLEHVYNALFMADGYENGEPHWQIRNDGRLMFSVMVDDTRDIRVQSRIDRRIVKDAGLHRVYFTEPFWDLSKSGQWFHIVAVYDPIGRRVVQYVNGRQLSREEITDKFHVSTLRIGPAEIGNWGQPFRKTPWFAVRNLNGTIDEMAIFDAVLSAEDIQLLYEQGKPLGY